MLFLFPSFQVPPNTHQPKNNKPHPFSEMGSRFILAHILPSWVGGYVVKLTNGGLNLDGSILSWHREVNEDVLTRAGLQTAPTSLQSEMILRANDYAWKCARLAYSHFGSSNLNLGSILRTSAASARASFSRPIFAYVPASPKWANK